MSSQSSDTRLPTQAPQSDQQPEAVSPPSWWSAPAGKPLPIPAFARGFLEVLLDLLMPRPAPVPVPVKVRSGTRRR